MPTPPRRRWFQFSIAAMLVVVTAVAVFISYHVNWIRQRRELLAEKCHPYTPHADDVDREQPFWFAIGEARTPGLLWLFDEQGVESLRLSGVWDHSQHSGGSIEKIKACMAMAEPDLARARALFPEAKVDIGFTKVVPVPESSAGP